MRVNKWGVGVVLAAAVMLTGCSAGASDKPADEKPSSSASQEAEAPATDCPELKEGATVDGSALGACIADTASSIAGYATTSTVMGMETTGKYNPAEKALESDSPLGSIIVIGDDAWVKSATGAWQVADPQSTDPVIAGLSTGAAAASQSSPAMIASLLKGELTVTGTGERLGQQVFLVSGTVEVQGVSSEIVLEVTKDYAPLATTTKASVGGTSVESTTLVTEWDVTQEIVAPL